MKLTIHALCSLILLFYGCNNANTALPTVTGNKYEVLVVMDLQQWKASAGREVVKFFDCDMEGLPQAEPIFKIIQCNRKNFTDALKPSRNIFLTQISTKYTQPKVIYIINKWAKPQSVVVIQAANDSIFENTLKIYGDSIIDFFLQTELKREIDINRTTTNKVAKADIIKEFGLQIDITKELNKSIKKKDFYWITNDNVVIRKDIIIYSYPYTDKNTFTLKYILSKRDSVLKANIPCEIDGSYMGTEYKFIPPTFKAIVINNEYCAEVRGLWKVKNGSAMGGPFISHTRLDKQKKRVITIEGFVFAPGVKKHNSLRQLEAIINSAKF